VQCSAVVVKIEPRKMPMSMSFPDDGTTFQHEKYSSIREWLEVRETKNVNMAIGFVIGEMG
jgi:hypothetical protein